MADYGMAARGFGATELGFLSGSVVPNLHFEERTVMRHRSRSSSRLTGSLVLLSAGTVVVVIAVGVLDPVNPVALLLGGMAMVGGLIGLLK